MDRECSELKQPTWAIAPDSQALRILYAPDRDRNRSDFDIRSSTTPQKLFEYLQFYQSIDAAEPAHVQRTIAFLQSMPNPFER